MERPTIPCRLCSKPTPMLGTKLCDPCWHVENAVTGNPDLARRILAGMEPARTESKVSVEAAREALDSLDDYARMGVGVDAHGPRGMLERFIAQTDDLIEAAPVIPDYEVTDTGHGQLLIEMVMTREELDRYRAALAACTPAKSEESK